MLAKLIAFSLKNAALVLVLAAAIVAFAAYKVPRMAVDVFPELNAPTVVILTEAGGLSADEVEQYVTFPIETAVNGVPGVRRVRSGSAISLSIVYVEFDWGTDIFRARTLVSERIGGLEERMPERVHVEMTPITGITGEIMLLSLSSPDGSAPDTALRAFGEYDLRNRLLAVPGVAQVVAIGGELPEYQVNVQPDKLVLFDLTVKDVIDAAGEAHSTASAGYLTNVGGLEMPLRQTARVRSADDIKGTTIKYHKGAAVTVGQVADVVLAGAPKRGTGAEGGKPAVVLSVQKSPGVNTLTVTRDIDKALDQAEAGMPKGMRLNRHVMRQTDFINLSLRNVLHVLRDATIFVAVILILFLLNVRTTIITLTALPLSLAVALLALWAWGLSINVMTLGGLAVAIGELVDDAIIDVENVFRRLRENAALPLGEQKQFLQVIYDASNEIRSSVVFATVIIVIVFVPLLFLQGLEGRFFRPLGIAYITSILASLVVALTVTPALCKYLLRGKLGGAGHETDGFLVRWLKRVYRPALELALRWRIAVVALAVVATGLSVLLARTFGTSFLPEFNEGTITVFLTAPPGTSLHESDRLAQAVDRRLVEIEGVRAVVRRTGRAERDEHAEPVSRSEIDVSLKPGYRREDLLGRIDTVLASIPGIHGETGQPISHRLSHILSGTPAAIAISVFGEDLPTLRKIAREAEAELKKLPGTRDVTGNREAMITTLPIRYRHDDLRRFGLTPAGAAEQVTAAMFGEVVAEVNEGVKRYDIVVRLDPESRRGVQDVRDLVLRGKGGAAVRLREVADIGPEDAAMAIQRENARRKAVISTNVAEGHNLGHLVEEVKRVVDPIVARHGYAVDYGGQFEAQQSASKTIYLMGSGVILVILLLLYMAFGSFRAALLVMVNLPLALIGGIAAVYITESPSLWRNTLGLFGIGAYVAPVLSIASMVGFVTLFGIAVRNGILLVNHYRHLMKEEGKPVEQAVLQGSMERLVPILMTALAAVLGLVPLAMAAGEPGSELLAPLAVVVLGGLVTSTFLNLVVVPAGYSLIFSGRRAFTPADATRDDGVVPAAPLRETSW
jgi:HME family heavy-metal exporter